MKLKDITSGAIEILKQAETDGILNTELAKELQIPRRRVYDIIAILKSTGLVKVKRESSGSRIFWQGKESITERKLTKMMEVNNELNRVKCELENKIVALTNRLKEKENTPIIGETKSTIHRTRMQHPIIRVIPEVPGSIKRFHSDGLGVVIETTSSGVIIEPVIRKTKIPWEADQTVFTRLK